MSDSLPGEIVNLNFLVVDDYESMRIMIASHLRDLGIKNISFSSSGNAAAEFILKNENGPSPVQFVLTDLAMDEGTGIDLVKKIREKSNLKNLPVLMITSKSEVSFVIDAARAGVNNYIVKPWQIEELKKKIIDTFSKAKK